MGKYYLISGASSGIGKDLAQDLAQQGHHVFATAPTEEGQQSLVGVSDRITPLLLDIRAEEHIIQAKKSILQHTDRLDGLINNAGIGLAGPVELLDLASVRNLFEVNVFGHLKMTQSFLPLLRNAEQGRIVFTGSVAGFFVLPLSSPYSASKFALRAFCDALRIELQPQNIQVSLIQPGSINTAIWSKPSFDGAEHHLESDRYGAAIVNAQRAMKRFENGASPVRIVTKAMNHALFSDSPKDSYLVGYDAHLAFWSKILPSFLTNFLLRRFFL